MADYTFMNPYTFIPLPEGGAVRSDMSKQDEPVFSGEIKCSLISKTQIAVPDKVKNPNAPETEIREYDFFRVDSKAVIPGSGIRGVIRSVFETLTDSCMRLNDKDDDYFHTRVNKTDPGIIEYRNGEYILYKAERLRDKEDRGFENDNYFTGKPIDNIDALPGKNHASRIVNWRKKGELNGVYLRVDQFGKKSHPSVFIKEKYIGVISEIYVERLRINAEKYKGKYAEDYDNAIKKMKNDGGQLPVWYWQDRETGHYYFAPSQYSRAVFVNKPRDIAENARIESCTSKDNICAACALFGFIGEDSRASRVRFTDAVCGDESCFDKAYVLPVLSGPRLSSFEFYLDGKGKKAFGPDSAGVTLAGRKFYWHDPNAEITADDDFAKDHPSMAVKTELVKAGSKFEFSVFFDKITDEQLKRLVFALNLGENSENSGKCHKIGHGKPIGLGSVKIVADSVVKRVYENGVYSVNDVTGEIVEQAKSSLFRQSNELQAFLGRALNFGFVGNNKVDYPRQQPDGDIFKWFAGNRGALRSKGYIEVKQTLPKITDNRQTLLGQISEKKNSGNNDRNNYGNKNNRRRW